MALPPATCLIAGGHGLHGSPHRIIGKEQLTSDLLTDSIHLI